MRKTIFFFSILSLSLHSYAQSNKKQKKAEKREHINALIQQEEEGVISYKKSFAAGIKLINDGYGAFMEIGRASSVKKSLLFQFEIAERKSSKEEKFNNYSFNASPFIYGKENFFYPVKLGVQQQVLLGNKSNKNGVSITGNYGGGITAGLLRPYYVQVPGNGKYEYVKYNSPDSLRFLDTRNIYGGPTFGKGWSDMTVVPGLYGKAGLRFDYGAFNEIVSAIEIGVSGELYSKKIPQMVYNSPNQFFFNGYVAIIFGKRK